MSDGSDRHIVAAALHLVITAVLLPLGPTHAPPFQIHCVVGFVTAVSHTIQSFWLTRTELVLPWRIRWSEYAVTAPLMSVASYITAGGSTFYIIILIMVTGSLTQAFGVHLEQGKNIWRSLVLGGGLQAVGTSFILYETFKNDADAALIAASILYGMSFATFPFFAATAARKFLSPNQVDTIYVALSVTSKISFLCLAAVFEYDVKLWQIALLSVPTLAACALLVSISLGLWFK